MGTPWCAVCKKDIPEGRRQYYCGGRCAKLAQAEQVRAANRLSRARRKAERPEVIQPCGLCGAPFLVTHASQKYCGEECRVAVMRGQNRESYARKRVKS